MRNLLFVTTAIVALATVPALAEDASGGHHTFIPVISPLHAPTDAANDDAQGVIDIAKGDVGKGAREVRDGTGCLFVRALNVGMTLGISLFDESVGTHDAYYRAHCVGHENDAGKTLAKLGVPAGPKVIGNATVRDLAGVAIDTAPAPAAGIFNGTAVGTAVGFAQTTSAAVGDAADAVQ